MNRLNIKEQSLKNNKVLNNIINKSHFLSADYDFQNELGVYDYLNGEIQNSSSIKQAYILIHKTIECCLKLRSQIKITVNSGFLENKNKSDVSEYIITDEILDNLSNQISYLHSELTNINILINIQKFESDEELESTINEISILTSQKIEEFQSLYESSLGKLNKFTSDSKNILKSTSSEYEKITIDKILEAEDSASNRVQVRIRNIELSISKYHSTVQNSQDLFKDEVLSQYESLKTLSMELRDEVIKSINNSSSSSLESIQTEQSKALTSFSAKSQDEVGKINKRIEDEVREFEGKKKEIELILGEISTKHQSAANTIQADKEEKSANLFRNIGIVWLIITILLSIIIFNDYIGLIPIADIKNITPLKDLGFEWFAIRFTTITLLTTPSVYMLKESASHRAKENLYRQRGTQLSSIGAYLGEMNSEERAKLKVDLAKNFFSFHDSKPDTSNVPDFIKNMKEAIEIAKAISPQQASANTEDKKENTQKA